MDKHNRNQQSTDGCIYITGLYSYGQTTLLCTLLPPLSFIMSVQLIISCCIFGFELSFVLWNNVLRSWQVLCVFFL